VASRRGVRTLHHSSASGRTRFAFCTGAQEQKQRNLDSNPQVAITTGTTGAARVRNGWDSGKDIVVEGTAVRVTSAESPQALAAAWVANYSEDWKFEVRGRSS
jgi:hypothetical protein